MLARIIWLCGAQWLVGLGGLALTSGLFGLGPTDPAFDLFARLWVAGGVGCVLLATASLAASALRAAAESNFDRR